MPIRPRDRIISPAADIAKFHGRHQFSQEKIRPEPGSLGPTAACAGLGALALRRTWGLID